MTDEPELTFYINGDIGIVLKKRNQNQQERWAHIKKVLDYYFANSEFSVVTEVTSHDGIGDSERAKTRKSLNCRNDETPSQNKEA